jgi:Kiwa KwaB-like protein
MASANPFSGLRAIVESAHHVNVMIAADAPGSVVPMVQRLNLHEDAAERFREAVGKALPEREDLELIPYEPGYIPYAHELLYFDLEDEPDLAGIIAGVAKVAAAEEFSESEGVIKRLRFYATVLSGGAQPSGIFFRNYSPKKELTRSTLFALVKRKGQYDTVEEKVFLFDDEVDCFAWEGRMYIRSVYQFQRIFRFFDRLRESVGEVIDSVTERVPIVNLEEFRQAVTGQVQMMAKLAAISRKGYLETLTMDAVRRTIDDVGLDVDLVEEDGVEKLVFDSSPKRRWLILKVLDDDYLRSIMTDAMYEANSKRGIGE